MQTDSAFSVAVRQRIHQLLALLFDSHVATARRKGLLQYTHVSKTGGTSLCHAAATNSCPTQFPNRHGCSISGKDGGWTLWA